MPEAGGKHVNNFTLLREHAKSPPSQTSAWLHGHLLRLNHSEEMDWTRRPPKVPSSPYYL